LSTVIELDIIEERKIGGVPALLARKIAAAKKRGRGGNFYPLLAGLSPKTPFPACGRQASRPARAFGFGSAARSAAINFVQNRFGFGCINAH